MYGAAIAFGTTLVVSNGIGPAGAGEFFRLMALFAIATSTAVFGADTGLVRTISAQNALGRYSAIPRLIRYAVLPPLALSPPWRASTRWRCRCRTSMQWRFG